jgi:hypothetical protein
MPVRPLHCSLQFNLLSHLPQAAPGSSLERPVFDPLKP